MVKIPNLDDLKKMGSNLLDTAKSVKLTEVVDKLKSGIETVGGKKSAAMPAADEAIQTLFTSIYTSLNEMAAAQAAEAEVIKKIQVQLSELAKVLERYQKTDTETKQDEEKKS